MPLAGCLLWFVAALLFPSLAEAQTPGRPGPYIADLRVVTSGLPDDPTFFPSVPSGTSIPARTIGFDVGAHVYPLGLGPARIGLGVSFVRAKGWTSTPQPAGSSSSAPQTHPDVTSTMSSLVPQLSLNFGSSSGWSYLGAGIGETRIRSVTSVYVPDDEESAESVAEATLDGGWRQTINIGGGARWFIGSRVAFSFDLRWHLVAARAAEEGSTPKTTLFVAGAGLSFR